MLHELLGLILFLNTLIVPIDLAPTKANFYNFANAMKPAYIELGLEDRELYIYWDLMKSSGATTIPGFQYNKYCGTKIEINPMHLGDEFIALAHETGHAFQGVACESKTAEAGATLLSLKALSTMDDTTHKQIYYRYLRQLLVWKFTDRACQLGVQDRYDFVVSCSEAYDRRPYTLALDWIMTEPIGITFRVSSLPVPIELDGILDIGGK